jgi:hypothetical protein
MLKEKQKQKVSNKDSMFLESNGKRYYLQFNSEKEAVKIMRQNHIHNAKLRTHKGAYIAALSMKYNRDFYETCECNLYYFKEEKQFRYYWNGTRLFKESAHSAKHYTGYGKGRRKGFGQSYTKTFYM